MLFSNLKVLIADCWGVSVTWLSVFTFLWQIVCALEQDDAARKQRLAFKLEQVVAFMSLES